MKNLFLLLIITSLLGSCKCQWKLATQKEIAAVASAGMTHIDGGKSYNPAVGAAAGAEIKVLECPGISSLIFGLNVSFQGANYEETISDYYVYGLKSAQDGSAYSGKISLSYLNVPLLYRYQGNTGFYAEAGLQPSFLLSAKDKVDDADSYDFKDYIKTFDLGVPVGAGYKLNDNISLGVRAVYGLTNINTEGTDTYSSDDKDHNLSVFGVFKYTFPQK